MGTPIPVRSLLVLQRYVCCTRSVCVSWWGMRRLSVSSLPWTESKPTWEISWGVISWSASLGYPTVKSLGRNLTSMLLLRCSRPEATEDYIEWYAALLCYPSHVFNSIMIKVTKSLWLKHSYCIQTFMNSFYMSTGDYIEWCTVV